MGAIALGIVIEAIAVITIYLVGSMIRSIQDETKSSGVTVKRNFGLSIAFCALFFISWVAQGVAQWQEYTDNQKTHNEPIEAGDFAADFSQATLENWQSEFLQLFSFVVLSALLIHKGSAESKDSSERVEATLDRIEQRLMALERDA